LIAAIKTTGHITHARDPETGSHLDRMSRFSRLIANELADQYQLDDSYIEHVFMFSSLHDIGKIAIPDYILLKEARLNEDEWAIMRNHPKKGLEMIDELLVNFGLENIEYIDVLRNIVEFHHETIDGTGYPNGLKGDEIPLEARIVATADIFDALTSRRPYKNAWTNEAAIANIQSLSGSKLDPNCVQALIDNMDQIIEIQSQFSESIYG
jgi:HD-GYP domain-containing protein (c-di-GMP phosphodiesterase class II)